MTYKEVLKISKTDDDYVNRACENSEMMGENDTLTWTVFFDNRFFMDIMCCGCKDYPAYTQCVLYDNQGWQVCWSDGDGFGVSGEWEAEAYGDTYIVDVVIKEEKEEE